MTYDKSGSPFPRPSTWFLVVLACEAAFFAGLLVGWWIT